MKASGPVLCIFVLAGLYSPAAWADTSTPEHDARTQTHTAPEGKAPGRFDGVFEEALAAYDAQQYAQAYNLWLSIARQGDLAAMRNLGHLLRRGLGVEANPEEAAKWYSIAATRGLTGAQVNLAELFYDGNGVPQSYKLAAQWYARAARAGHAHAQYKLARMIEDGHTSPGNVPLAKKLHGWAIDAGHSSALDRYRMLDARKSPLRLTKPLRHDASELALESTSSMKTLAGAGDTPKTDSFLFHKKDKGALLSAQQDFARGERSSAVTVWRRLALKNNSEAQYRLALALLQGHGTAKSNDEATYWLDIAATGGHGEAADLLRRRTAKSP